MEGNQTGVIESSDGDVKKLMASAVPESTKRYETKIRWQCLSRWRKSLVDF